MEMAGLPFITKCPNMPELVTDISVAKPSSLQILRVLVAGIAKTSESLLRENAETS